MIPSVLPPPQAYQYPIPYQYQYSAAPVANYPPPIPKPYSSEPTVVQLPPIIEDKDRRISSRSRTRSPSSQSRYSGSARSSRFDDRRDKTYDRRNDRDRDNRSYGRDYKKASRSPPKRKRDRSDSPKRRETQRDRKDSSYPRSKKPETEREKLLKNWRKNYCETSADISRKLEELADDEEREFWVRSSPADRFYKRVKDTIVESTTRLDALCTLFDQELIQRSQRVREKQKPYEPPPRKRKIKICKHHSGNCSSSSSESSDESDLDMEEDRTMEELSRKTQHPFRLHSDLWHNEGMKLLCITMK
jgi:ribonuclease-3